MMLADHAFVLAMDVSYRRMGAALIHSINHYHPDKEIKLFITEEDAGELTPWARRFDNVTVMIYRGAGRMSAGEWPPLVWAKLEAFAMDDGRAHVVLDVDQIMYSDVSRFVAEAAASGRVISASPDITSLRGHMTPRGAALGELARLGDPRCFNAGAMIIRPSRDAHRDLTRLAARHHAHMRLPEQGVLNAWARLTGEHHDLGDGFMLEPWSRKVLWPEPPSCLIHFWTPRPPFFGSSPRRRLEPTWEERLRGFEEENGAPYPTGRFERDFELRLRNFEEPTPARSPSP